MTGDTYNDGMEQIPPARNDEEMKQIPTLYVGDKVRVETRFDYAPDRTLTVVSDESDVNSDVLWGEMGGDDGYVLEGYGTEYHLTTTGTRHWRRVDIVFDSQPEGQTVSDIEVVERSIDTVTDHTGGDA